MSDMKLARTDPQECNHENGAEIKMPGSEHRVGWCRMCGSLWLPRFPELVHAFEGQPQKETGSRVGVRYTDQPGMWLYPGKAIGVVTIQ